VKSYAAAPASTYVVRQQGGRVLYVGVTRDLKARVAVHRCRSEWWTADHELTSEAFDSRGEAEAREVELIQQLKPLHNVQHQEPWRAHMDEIEALQDVMPLYRLREQLGLTEHQFNLARAELARRRRKADRAT
jgi:predicted GIY-YIG superfamily endonuclease